VTVRLKYKKEKTVMKKIILTRIYPDN
jgi:hypothetical protein